MKKHDKVIYQSCLGLGIIYIILRIIYITSHIQKVYLISSIISLVIGIVSFIIGLRVFIYGEDKKECIKPFMASILLIAVNIIDFIY